MYHQQDHVLFLLFYGVWVTDRLKRILSDGVFGVLGYFRIRSNHGQARKIGRTFISRQHLKEHGIHIYTHEHTLAGIFYYWANTSFSQDTRG